MVKEQQLRMWMICLSGCLSTFTFSTCIPFTYLPVSLLCFLSTMLGLQSVIACLCLNIWDCLAVHHLYLSISLSISFPIYFPSAILHHPPPLCLPRHLYKHSVNHLPKLTRLYSQCLPLSHHQQPPTTDPHMPTTPPPCHFRQSHYLHVKG